MASHKRVMHSKHVLLAYKVPVVCEYGTQPDIDIQAISFYLYIRLCTIQCIILTLPENGWGSPIQRTLRSKESCTSTVQPHHDIKPVTGNFLL